MEAGGLKKVVAAYFERLMGVELRDGESRVSTELSVGKPPFLLSSAAMQIECAWGKARAVALGMEWWLDGPLKDIPGKMERMRVMIPGDMLINGAVNNGSCVSGVNAMTPDMRVSGVSRLPNPDCAFCVIISGRAVSWASAADIGGMWFVTVETRPAYRGKGYAKRCLAALTERLLGEGKVPLYMCACDNEASAGVALGVGYIEYGLFTRIL